MKVKVKDTEYHVCFQHRPDDEINRMNDSTFILTRAGTDCMIYAGPPPKKGEPKKTPIACRSSVCHENDAFNRNIGRKRSLALALEALFGSGAEHKAERTLFWDAYREMRHGRM